MIVSSATDHVLMIEPLGSKKICSAEENSALRAPFYILPKFLTLCKFFNFLIE